MSAIPATAPKTRMKKKTILGISIGVFLLIVIPTVLILGYFIWRGMQSEVFLIMPGGSVLGNTSIGSSTDASTFLAALQSANLISTNTQLATTDQLQNAVKAGCSFCAFGWASDGNTYQLNTMVPSSATRSCGTQLTSSTFTSQVVPSGYSGMVGILCYGRKPSPRFSISNPVPSATAQVPGIKPWVWGPDNSGSSTTMLKTKWSQYSPRLTL